MFALSLLAPSSLYPLTQDLDTITTWLPYGMRCKARSGGLSGTLQDGAPSTPMLFF